MIIDHQKNILNKLIDIYERRLPKTISNNEETFRQKKVSLNFYAEKSDYLEYDIEDLDLRNSINKAVNYLEEIELITITWLKGENNHIIYRVSLNKENLSQTYDFLKRPKKITSVEKEIEELKILYNQLLSDWAKTFLKDTITQFENKGNFGRKLPIDKEERDNILKAISFLDHNQESEMLERIFSVKCFNNSKIFEKKVKPWIINILRSYQDFDDDTSEDLILRSVGITKYPEYFNFSGALGLRLFDTTIDFSSLNHGISISAIDLNDADIFFSSPIKKIISIENKTNYLDYLNKNKEKNELIIYHGGYFSPLKKKFFKSLSKCLPKNVDWFHWGDIDYGGYSMLLKLKTEINPRIKSHLMDLTTLKDHLHLTQKISLPYETKLAKLKERPELEDYFDCINFMIENHLKLEQEALID